MKIKDKANIITARVEDTVWEYWVQLPYGARSEFLSDLIHDHIESLDPVGRLNLLMDMYDKDECNLKLFIKRFQKTKERFERVKQKHLEASEKYTEALNEIKLIESEGILNQAIARLSLDEEQKLLDRY